MIKPEENIIAYRNDFSDIPLMGFSASEANVFMYTCYRYQQDLVNRFQSVEELEACPQEDLPSIVYDLKEFSKLCQYKKGSLKRFEQEVDSVRKKLISLSVVASEEGKRLDYPFFYEFKSDHRTLEVQLHKRAAKMLLCLDRNYTLHDIREFIEASSIFSKRCYRLLKRWRTVGQWEPTIEKFRAYLCIPDSYRMYDIDRRILSVIQKDLGKYFKDLRIEKIYGDEKGSPVKAIRFTFKKESVKVNKTSGFICPECGQPLIEKVINGNTCWCHEDGWKKDAVCSKIFNSVAEINGYEEVPKSSKGNESAVNNCIEMPAEYKEKWLSFLKE